jgi:tRNA (guanine-N7-)-methyltransferase
MPHIVAKSIEQVGLPIEADGLKLLHGFTDAYGDELVLADDGGSERFFLQKNRREKDVLVRVDKLTKVVPVSRAQKAIKRYAKAASADIVHSNIDLLRPKHALGNTDYLKSIDYFLEDFQKEEKGKDRPIIVEIGHGSGRHILHQAKQHPGKLFIGLEIHQPSIEQLIKQIKIQKLENIYVLNYDARIFLEFLPSNSVQKIYVHFPVPWDKKEHRRIFSRRFIDEATRVLDVGGEIDLRTDSDNYFHYVFSLYMDMEKSEIRVKKNAQIEVSSKYEDRWVRREKNIYDILFTNRVNSPPLTQPKKLTFDQKLSFGAIRERFHSNIMRSKHAFVRFEKIFSDASGDNGAIKLSFGAYEKSEHQYITVIDGEVAYFPSSPIPSRENTEAHQMIEKFIYG